MKKQISGVTLETVQGDIASQEDIDAVVNAANARLMPGGGVAGAIHRAAGRGLAEECKPLVPIKPGDAVITGAHNLPNSHVIHCLGPVYGVDKPEDKLLRNCYKKALDLAEDNNIESIAFPAISTGAFGYPLKEATEIAVDTVAAEIPALKKVKLIRFVLFGKKELDVYEEIISKKL
ncbi:Appr-1-p processing domain protein [Flexistipes sinusarabici DSM 4947]|uniref:Appr-1-p processing domain protein n=1 Tax=Flexistipes sinusarabici (strain ATCC 49648 / DSM 4947 / MAS 10) TaxID=717231 RepID=F8E7L5_FLESM|nr:macro domain-containing protein [Flexistipes sinusarabici]AEI13860.1 Appr-1-p processing domain protein [Flexistipes sinusarabici DSM 4947]